MKAATGELNLTVITIIAIATIIGFFTMTMWPRIRNSIDNQWNGVDNNSAAVKEWANTGMIILDK